MVIQDFSAKKSIGDARTRTVRVDSLGSEGRFAKILRGMSLAALSLALSMLAACGGGGGGQGSPPPAPTIASFQVSPGSITAGSSAQLVAVFANGTGTVTPGGMPINSGTGLSVSPSTTTEYTLTVGGAGGSASAKTTVTVLPAPSITAFTATPATITLGGTSTLSFSFSNGTGAINGGIGAVMSGGTKVVNPGGTTTYTLTVTNALGATFTATATVTVVPAPTIASYTATPATIMVGGSSTLAYSFANGTGVINQGVGAVISGGTKVVSPGTTTAYTLTVTNAAGAAVAATAMVSVTGVFVPTGSLSVPRSRHCAALLPNGKVLIVGGEQHTSQPYPQATAEVYDPVTGAFSPTGSMVGLWFAHSATLLPSGEVLVIGIGAGGANSELYNPISGTFRATTGSPRGYMAPVLLPNGKVLTTGGGATWSVRVAIRGYYVADLYNPNSQTFSPTGTMSYARGGHTATLLSTGKVLVAGGFGDFFDYPDDAIAFAELYDPITGSFGYTHDMNSGRVGHTATLLPNGKVLIVGGLIRWDLGAGVLETAEIYDPTTKTFSPTGNMHWKRVGHTATLLPNGKVLVTGGCYGGEAEQYDPSLGLFFPTGNMGACRVSHTSTLLPNGKVLIVGGSSANGANDALASALLYQ